MAPYTRPFLEVRQTTLRDLATGKRQPFNGLFTTRKIRAGEFVGFYSGKWYPSGYEGSDTDYLFGTVCRAEVRPPRRKDRSVDPVRYPMAMINEPPPGTRANVASMEYTKAKNVIGHLKPSTKICAVAFHACRDIPAGKELFMNYGDMYDRSEYSTPRGRRRTLAGPMCSRRRMHDPVQMAQKYGLHYVSDECYSLRE